MRSASVIAAVVSVGCLAALLLGSGLDSQAKTMVLALGAALLSIAFAVLASGPGRPDGVRAENDADRVGAGGASAD